MDAATYGLDVAKQIFKTYWVDAQTGEIANRRFRRDELIALLALRPVGRVALEACASAHWCACKIKALGHKVVLLHAKFIRPFVRTNKTDATRIDRVRPQVPPCRKPTGRREVLARRRDGRRHFESLLCPDPGDDIFRFAVEFTFNCCSK